MDINNTKIWEDDVWIKHVYDEGSRFHVLYWTNKGCFCKEKNCIKNAPDKICMLAYSQGIMTETFLHQNISYANFSKYQYLYNNY